MGLPATAPQFLSSRSAQGNGHAHLQVCRAAPLRSRRMLSVVVSAVDKECWLLDYGAGNVRSVRNAIKHLGYTVNEARPTKRRLLKMWI